MTDAEVSVRATRLSRTVTVTGMPEIRDARRSPFTPSFVTVSYSWGPQCQGHSHGSLEVRGRRANGRWTQTGFGFDQDGHIEPDHRNGPAPNWLVLLTAEVLIDLGPMIALGFAHSEEPDVYDEAVS
jgi:hypothetical protein